MGNFRPLATPCWIKFLVHHGFDYDRTKGSHYQYTKKGHRTIPVWGDEKQIPAQHLKTGCNSIGCTMEQLYGWAEQNC